jgi:hypothetical protein
MYEYMNMIHDYYSFHLFKSRTQNFDLQDNEAGKNEERERRRNKRRLRKRGIRRRKRTRRSHRKENKL